MSRNGLESTGSDPGPRAGARTVTAPLRDAAAGHHHHARSVVAAVGLERQPPAGPERLPSDRPEPCGPGGLCHVRCSRARHRPAPCRLLRAWGRLVKGRRVASSYPAPPANRLAALRVVRRERCASPTSATDSLHEHPADCCVSGRASAPLPALRRMAMRRAHAHPGPWPSGARSWGDLTDRIPGEQPDGALA